MLRNTVEIVRTVTAQICTASEKDSEQLTVGTLFENDSLGRDIAAQGIVSLG